MSKKVSNPSASAAAAAAANSFSKTTWVTISYADGCLKSKDDFINGRKDLTFLITDVKAVLKPAFSNGATKIPEQHCLQLSGEAYREIGSDEIQGVPFKVEMPLKDRSRTCNVFLNKFAYAIQEYQKDAQNWDGFARIAIYEKDGQRKLFASFFETCENAEHYKELKCDFFPYDENLGYFENVPKPERLLNKKGEPLQVDGKDQYDNSDFDAFYLDFAEAVCVRFNEIAADLG